MLELLAQPRAPRIRRRGTFLGLAERILWAIDFDCAD
jgi:hypothetical protein